MIHPVAPISPAAEKLADAFGEVLRDMLLKINQELTAAAGPDEPCAEVLAAICAAHLCGFLRRFGKGPDPKRLLETVIGAAFEAGEEIAMWTAARKDRAS